MQNTYVAGDLAALLRSYLDAEQLPAPEIRRALAGIAPNTRMSMQNWWSLLEEIQAIQPVPALGLRIGRLVRPHHSGILGYLVMACDTLGEALLRFQHYQSLLHNLSAAELKTGPQSLTISWDVKRGRSTQLSDEVFISAVLALVREITARPDICPSKVTFNHEVAFDHSEYESMLGCPVEFDCKHVSIAVPVSALSIPINGRDPHLLALLEKQAAALLSRGRDHDELLSQLHHAVAELLPQGTARLPECARQLHLSTRTLHRRLNQRGLNFNQVLRQTRQQLTRMYLQDPSLSLSEIAFLLGYSEQSAFSRACREWFSMTPKDLRARLSQGLPATGTSD